MIRRIWVLLTSALLVTSLLAGCNSSPKPTAANGATGNNTTAATPAKQTSYPVTVKDDAGRDVTIAAEPKRIVSIAPSDTELVYALGKGSLLVGRSEFDDYPPEVKQVDSIGGGQPMNYEAIVGKQPDLVLMIGGSQQDRDKLTNDYKLNVFVLDPQNFDQLYAGIKNLGVVLNAQPQAEKVITDMQQGMKAVTDKVSKATTKPKVFYEVWDNPLMTAGSGTFINDLIQMAGGQNAGADAKGWAPYSMEKLVADDPDMVIAASPDVVAKLKGDPAWASLRAVKDGKMVGLQDPNLVVRPGPRLVLGLQWLAQTIHPELFK